jgi:hypothetical protein
VRPWADGRIDLYEIDAPLAAAWEVGARELFNTVGGIVLPSTPCEVLRMDLSDDQLASYVLNESNGRLIKVPTYYWNSSSAKDVLWCDCATTVEVEGRELQGRILFLIRDLSAYWRRKGWLPAAEDSPAVLGGLSAPSAAVRS